MFFPRKVLLEKSKESPGSSRKLFPKIEWPPCYVSIVLPICSNLKLSIDVEGVCITVADYHTCCNELFAAASSLRMWLESVELRMLLYVRAIYVYTGFNF